MPCLSVPTYLIRKLVNISISKFSLNADAKKVLGWLQGSF